jgi:Ser/Thr protein kinase RdoA (MazF antagonist)
LKSKNPLAAIFGRGFFFYSSVEPPGNTLVMMQKISQPAFHSLTPETVIGLVEESMGIYCTNLCRPLNSYINRVYELQSEEGDGLVAKFYRPGRWSRLALQDEHDFLLELAAADIPVIAPLSLKGNVTLAEHDTTFFTVFPKMGGRSYDEFTDEQWLELGRLLGRTHAVGARHTTKDRILLTPDTATRKQVDYILEGGFIPPDLLASYEQTTSNIIAEIAPLFIDVEMIRIHGDCHFANLIYRPDESFFLIDFDDMVVGPPVHDLWMLLPGFLEDSRYETEVFLEGYQTFHSFDRKSLRLIEPLRVMRFIHFSAWCAHQIADGGFVSVVPDFGSHTYWQTEITDLEEQLERIISSPDSAEGNVL